MEYQHESEASLAIEKMDQVVLKNRQITVSVTKVNNCLAGSQRKKKRGQLKAIKPLAV